MTKEGMKFIQAAELARDRRKKAILTGASDSTIARLLVVEAAAVTEAAAVVGKGAAR